MNNTGLNAEPGRKVHFSTDSLLPSQSSTINYNPMNDIEINSFLEDSISCLQFSPKSIEQTYLIAGSWDNTVKCWEIDPSTRKSYEKAIQSMNGPILDVSWSDDGGQVFMASCDKTVKCWDLNSNQASIIAQHDAPVKTCHYIKTPNYNCIMTSSWDKTIKFWDLRSPNQILKFDVPEKCFFADVLYPFAVVGIAKRGLIFYQLENTPSEYKRIDSPLKFDSRCVALFPDKRNDSKFSFGYALGSTEGRVAIQYTTPLNLTDNFAFKCHREFVNSGNTQDIYPVNDIKFHPIHGTFATVGGDGVFNFWDKDSRQKLISSQQMWQGISCCAFNSNGRIYAYAVSYEWSKGHAHHNPQKKNVIFLRNCFEEMYPKPKPPIKT